VSNKSPMRTVLLWAAALLFTLGSLTYQDRTGPTYPLEGTLQTAKGPVHFKFLRSEVIGTDLDIMLADPVPAGVTATVKYRRYKSADEWATMPMEAGQFTFTRRGVTGQVTGIGARLPSLKERAGKYEFFVYVNDGSGEPISVTRDVPIYARYKADVPTSVLIVHVFVIFLSMLFAMRTVLEAAIDGQFKWMLWTTIVSLVLGAFVLGPIVQQYAFGVLWAGVPFGWDWTDNKVLVELAFWALALYLNRGDRRNRAVVFLAGLVTLIVYFIPHSVFGSEYNYTTGGGRGTAGN
jgi:hypothetical protein